MFIVIFFKISSEHGEPTSSAGSSILDMTKLRDEAFDFRRRRQRSNEDYYKRHFSIGRKPRFHQEGSLLLTAIARTKAVNESDTIPAPETDDGDVDVIEGLLSDPNSDRCSPSTDESISSNNSRESSNSGAGFNTYFTFD